MLGIRQRGQLGSDCPPAVTKDSASKGGNVRAGAKKLHERVELQGGYNKAYIRRIAVFPRGASTLCSIFRHSRQAWHSGRIPPSTTAEPIFPEGNGSYRAWQAGLACGSGRTLPPPEQELALGGHSCRRRRPTRTRASGRRRNAGYVGGWCASPSGEHASGRATVRWTAAARRSGG